MQGKLLIDFLPLQLVSLVEEEKNFSRMSREFFAMEELLQSSSDDDDLIVSMLLEEDNDDKTRQGSVTGHQVVNRDRLAGHERLYKDYFSDNPTYGPIYFRRRFRMRRSLFLRIKCAVEEHDNYFVQKRNAAGTLGLSALQKVTAALRILAYGGAADAIDDYVRIGASTALESLKKFIRAVIEVFGDEYLRSPNDEDTARLLAMHEQRGFPGMLGSIDCMHWRWKNCPTSWHGQYTGHTHEATIILEAVASQDLWIWHAFFGLPGSHNDINVLQRSPLFSKLAEGQAPEVNYSVNGHDYTMGYYLADGIYPPWATFVKTIPVPQGNKRKHFAQSQEAARKDVERAFGVLQTRFAVVRGPARYLDQATLADIMIACVIMHNMIVEDEWDEDADFNFYEMGEMVEVSHDHIPEIDHFIENYQRIKDRGVHLQLQNDLVEHLWEHHGN